MAEPKASAAPAQPNKSSIFRRMLGFLRPYRWQFALAMSLTLVIAVINPLRPYLINYAIDNPVKEGSIEGLRYWIVVLVGLIVLHTIIMYFQTWFTAWLGQRVMDDLRQQVFNHTTRLRIQYFDRTPIGALQTRTISDIETLNEVFSTGLVTIVGEMLQLIFIGGFMFYTDWRLTLVVLTVLPLIVIATQIFRVRVKGSFERVRKYVSELNTFTQEHVTGMLTTQVFNREKEEIERFRVINRKHRKAHLDTILYYSVFFPVVEILSALAIALLVWYGTGGVLSGRVSFGDLIAFLIYIQIFFRPIRMLADQFNTLQMGMVSAERVLKLLDNTDILPDSPEGVTAPPAITAPPEVEFKDVSFAYQEDHWILKNISFLVPAGSKTALVGATGSGKSSIVNLLVRFYDFQKGQVLINGHDLLAYPQEALRRSMGLALQDVYLFSGSIYDNATLNNPNITREQVQQAAREIGADQFIERMPNAYDYQVGERGSLLSAGQRQLVSFIRTLVYNPSILLLDEATANIDTETEEAIQAAIDRLLYGRTALIVAHRLSTIQEADQILVLSRGVILERGKHQELLAAGGAYRKLYELQYHQHELA
jgi:ATP-binding cassette, subfamily B, multidrug efflux pump